MTAKAPQQRNFRRGDQVEATVVEVVDRQEFLVLYDGATDDPDARLLRLKNQSRREWKTGDRVMLQVLEVAPLKFKFIEPIAAQKKRGRLNLSV